MPRVDDAGVTINDNDSNGKIVLGSYPGTIPTTANKFAVGAVMVDTTTGKAYYNSGTVAAPVWNSVTEITNAEVYDSQSVTSTADGTGTGAITAPTTLQKFVTVTSAAATNQVALPAISASTIGQEIYLTVGANGYELITPASSNNTINLVDSDGTNQLDVAANSTVRCKQVTATSWLCEQITATAIAVVAPDND